MVATLGIVSLIAFAVVLTRADSAFAGRAYAAYGGIYIAASLLWLSIVERLRPTVTITYGDLLQLGLLREGITPHADFRERDNRGDSHEGSAEQLLRELRTRCRLSLEGRNWQNEHQGE